MTDKFLLERMTDAQKQPKPTCFILFIALLGYIELGNKNYHILLKFNIIVIFNYCI